MPESAYWLQRRLALLDQMEADEERLKERLARIYEAEARKLADEVAAYYRQYGEGDVLEYRQMLAGLSDADRELLMQRMDEFARKYPKYAHLMPVRASVYKLDRLQGLQLSIWLQQVEIGAMEIDELQSHLREHARQAANLAAEELGFGREFYTVNAPVIEATVGEAWAQGEAFSERIWADRVKLAAYLSDDFAKSLARGDSYRNIVGDMARRFMNVSQRDIYRLVYTEGTFVFNEAQAKVHEDMFDYYRISTVSDKRVCEECRELEREQQAKPVRFDERQPGVNFPPLHPWCRCSYIPEVEDWDEWIERRVARAGGDYIQRRDRPDLNYLYQEGL